MALAVQRQASPRPAGPPARFILAVASIHSHRAGDLRQAGFEVVEPDDDDDPAG